MPFFCPLFEQSIWLRMAGKPKTVFESRHIDKTDEPTGYKTGTNFYEETYCLFNVFIST